MNEFRSVLRRFGRLVLYGRFGDQGAGPGGHAGPGAPALSRGMVEHESAEQPKPARHPAWLVLEILLVTILVFFWL